MRIHGMCIVKNESDIIEQTLICATKWCDFIYVFDNGSTDTTWQKVLNLSRSYQQIIPYKQDDCIFDDSLRGQIFNHYKMNFDDGDWLLRIDADEIYIDDPRIFLAKIPPQYEIVCAAMLTYYFTDKDLQRYKQNPLLYADYVPVEQKCRYYLNDHSEIRFFKYRKDLIWRERSDCLIWSDYKDWPNNLKGDAYPVRIWLKNYRYRSPQQIQKRIDTRRELTYRGLFPQEMQYRWKEMTNGEQILSSEIGNSTASHLKIEDRFWCWESRIVDAAKLDYDAGDRKYILREDLMLDIDKILIGYGFKVTPGTVIKGMARQVKRKFIQLGLLSNPVMQSAVK